MNREPKDINALRQNYTRSELQESKVGNDPMQFFKKWFCEAQDSNILEPNAMILSTVSADLRSHSRTVLLKEITIQGFVFYSNYQSAKAMDIEHSAHVSVTFLWKELERQVRIEGKAEKVSVERSEKYFQSRPRGSQLGAWASPQSDVIMDRSVLHDNLNALKEKYPEGSPIPIPPHWGGYEIKPDLIEFWQGRESRLHDRLVFTASDDLWTIVRLAP